MAISIEYAQITHRDPNPIKRWIQQRRLRDAATILAAHPAGSRPRVLDFGAGDGELIRRLSEVRPIEATVYEPTREFLEQAQINLAAAERISFAQSLHEVESGVFDYVTCLEVFEHLPPEATAEALRQIRRLLKPTGVAVIGVPHELYLPALVKGCFRMVRRYGSFDARWRTVLAAAVGKPPAERPELTLAPGLSYYPQHTGFDYRALEQTLREQFRLEKRWFSPIAALGRWFNSEVYYQLRLQDVPPVALRKAA